MANAENKFEVVHLGPDDAAQACDLLPALARNEIAAIHISRFLDREALDAIIANMGEQSITWYPNKVHEQGRVGINATGFPHKEGGKEEYFALTPAAEEARDAIFEGTESPIDKITEFFSNGGYRASVATEPGMQDSRYFAGLIRAMGKKSTLHFDYAPVQLPGWEVAKAVAQFGLVLYLQMPKEGGELNVYDHQWVPEDEVHNLDAGEEKGVHGFTEGFLGDTPHASVRPVAGDLVVFLPRNFHQVGEIASESDKPRLGLTTFMSLMKDRSLRLWS